MALDSYAGFPSTKAGVGDVEAGVGLSWALSKTFSHVLAFDIVAPTGDYGSATGSGSSTHQFIADPMNLRRNYWSFNPIWLFTYIGDKTSPVPGFEVSGKLMYWINTVNSATSYVSGQEFMADYLVGYHMGNVAVGANGFFLYQTTNDTQFGHKAVDPLTGIATGVRGESFSVGPAISYNIPHGCITFKYQRDLYAENRPEGDKFWLRWICMP